jgi:predicted nucleotidyltransferase
VNGDGFADLIVGAYRADPNGVNSGASYVVFGKASAFGATLDLSTLDGSNGFQINGEAAGEMSGFSVASAGDINGDGFADLIIGAPRADPNGSYSGASYVVFGKASGFAANFDLSSLNGTNGFQINGEAAYDQIGFSVAAAGDFNGDGFADLIIGAPAPATYGSGASYVVFGKASGFDASLDLSTLDGTNAFQINGEVAQAQTGRSVAAAGDINGDGFADLIIGAPQADPNGTISGASYVLFGRATTVGGGQSDQTLTGTAQPDTISGGKGDDTVLGLAGNDTLNGETGKDTLVGGAGDDMLDGGRGADTLVGGDGDDAFIFDAHFGRDTVEDLGDADGNEGMIAFSTSVFADFAEVIEKIKARSDAIQAEGVRALYVYGSRARGKYRPDSDLDVFVEYDPAGRFSLLNLAGVKLILEDALGLAVHVKPATVSTPS